MVDATSLESLESPESLEVCRGWRVVAASKASKVGLAVSKACHDRRAAVASKASLAAGGLSQTHHLVVC